jgi:GTP-binding protein
MSLPKVVIVGRPNVGKSSLFNWLAGIRLAIVDPTAGVTRDRVTHLIGEGGRFFELVDTGGIGIEDADDLTDEVEQQIEIAIQTASVVLFVVDTQTGVAPLDEEVARRLRPVAAPVILVANKADSPKQEAQVADFFRLGYGEPLAVSALRDRGRDELVERLLAELPVETEEAPPGDPEMKVAIVGRRNVGKSTFVNSLAHEERMIVSEVPGTTRDSVDVRFEMDGKAFVAIDTPGLTRTRSIKSDLEFYSFHRAQRSIRRADVVLLFFDAAEPIGRADKQLAQYVCDQHKPCMFVVNKWDLYAGKVATDEWAKYLRDTFPTMAFVPIAFVTGQTGKNVKTLINHAQMLFRQARERITTGQLNRILQAAITRNPPPTYQNRRAKIFYATQVGTEPPTIVVFVNDPAAFSEPYRRYLLTALRDDLSFGEVPIRVHYRMREAGDARDEVETAAARE